MLTLLGTVIQLLLEIPPGTGEAALAGRKLPVPVDQLLLERFHAGFRRPEPSVLLQHELMRLLSLPLVAAGRVSQQQPAAG